MHKPLTALLTLSILSACTFPTNSQTPRMVGSDELGAKANDPRFCAPINVDYNYWNAMEFNPDVEIAGLQGGTTNREGEAVKIELNKELIFRAAREMGIPDDKLELYYLAVAFHEECVHGLEKREKVYFDEPIEIPFNYSGMGRKIIGTYGTILLVENHEGEEIEYRQFAEMIATYLMFNNDTINPNVYDFPKLHSENLRQLNLYKLAEALQNNNLIDFYEVIRLMQEGKTSEVWNLLLLGKDMFGTDENGVNSLLAKLTLLQSIGEEQTEEEYIIDYSRPFPNVGPGVRQ